MRRIRGTSGYASTAGEGSIETKGRKQIKFILREWHKKEEKQDNSWRTVKPKEEEPMAKQIRGKQYHCCPYHWEDGMWTIHKPEECKLKPKSMATPQVKNAETEVRDELSLDYKDEKE